MIDNPSVMHHKEQNDTPMIDTSMDQCGVSHGTVSIV